MNLRNLSNIRQFISYILLGGVGAGVDLSLYSYMVHSSVPALLANVISTIGGIGTSYMLNSIFTFKESRIRITTVTKFFTVGLGGLCLSTGFLWLLTEILLLSPILSKILVMPLIALFQFILNKRWTFIS